MPLDIIVGTQWGDEGKGRFVDLLSSTADFVARYNGGDNAGHTVNVGSKTYKIHLIPSGIIHPQTIGVLGNGMAINPETLTSEIKMLQDAGIEINPQRLRISHAAHLITPAHKALDRAREKSLGNDSIGTTCRGVGPAYTDKAIRQGLRLELFYRPEDCFDQVKHHTMLINQQLESIYHCEGVDVEKTAEIYAEYAMQYQSYIDDVGKLIVDALQSGKKVLAEGAQGTLLDIDLGTYPFVTSSNCTTVNALSGLGIGLRPVNQAIGITKAFQTRVGEGPFPTEQDGDVAGHLRGTGSKPWDEYGTTTGRPRRVGWLDGVLLRYAVQVNGLTETGLTKLDVLSGLDTIKICTSYQFHKKNWTNPPLGLYQLDAVEPVYEEFPGWKQDLQHVRKWDDLPTEAKNYVNRIMEIQEVPMRWISVGPEREQVIQLD